MKTLLHLVLLFGAMTGLLGQSIAMAMAPVASVSVVAMVDMGDCADMADEPTQGETPCKKITLQCIAAMGCAAAAIALPTFTPEAAPTALSLVHARSKVAAMVGSSVAPALDPPAFLI